MSAIHQLLTISPLDGRYGRETTALQPYFSEYALNHFRLITEVKFLLFFAERVLKRPFNKAQTARLLKIADSFSLTDAEKLKEIELTIHHDVKAVEYYLRDAMREAKLPHDEYIHFGLTSEDTNSLAYGLALNDSLQQVMLPALERLLTALTRLVKAEAKTPMLARTHGQAAVPTTLGKEIVVFVSRLHQQIQQLKQQPITAKLSGAIGTYSALRAGFPDTDWQQLSRDFILSLGLTPIQASTQIVPGEYYSEMFHIFERINSILIDLTQDFWQYISLGYFIQHKEKNQVGSSTMPHKVNPIHFENAEGNLGLANALLGFFAAKLPISRLQRDLSDSTVKRNFGSAFAYCLVGYSSCIRGLNSLRANRELLAAELDQHWEIVAEGIQIILKTSGDADSYQKLQSLSQGKRLDKAAIDSFISDCPVSAELKQRMRELTPTSYVGSAPEIVATVIKEIYGN